MPARVRLTDNQLALARAIDAGPHDDWAALGAALGIKGVRAGQIALNAERSGIVSLKRDGKTVIVSSLKLTKRGEDLRAASTGDAPTPKPRKGHTAARAVKRAVTTASARLEDSISVTYSPAEIDALGDLSDKLAALVAVLRAQPKLGAKGAAAMLLIATLMAGG